MTKLRETPIDGVMAEDFQEALRIKLSDDGWVYPDTDGHNRFGSYGINDPVKRPPAERGPTWRSYEYD